MAVGTYCYVAVCRLGCARRFVAHRGRRGAGHIVAAAQLQLVIYGKRGRRAEPTKIMGGMSSVNTRTNAVLWSENGVSSRNRMVTVGNSNTDTLISDGTLATGASLQ